MLWNIHRDLREPDYQLGGAAEIQQLIGRSGITPELTVVFYGYGPALGLWLLKVYGHRDARILDCSQSAWQGDGRPWSTEVPEIPATSDPQYLGGRFWPSGGMEEGGRAGRVPGAVHQSIDGIYDDRGAFRRAHDLARILSGVDLADDIDVITYLHRGRPGGDDLVRPHSPARSPRGPGLRRLVGRAGAVGNQAS